MPPIRSYEKGSEGSIVGEADSAFVLLTPFLFRALALLNIAARCALTGVYVGCSSKRLRAGLQLSCICCLQSSALRYCTQQQWCRTFEGVDPLASREILRKYVFGPTQRPFSQPSHLRPVALAHAPQVRYYGSINSFLTQGTNSRFLAPLTLR